MSKRKIIMKKLAALSLAALLMSSSTIGVFANENISSEEVFTKEYTLSDEELLNVLEKYDNFDNIELSTEDINDQIKGIYKYGEVVDSEETEFGTVYYIDSQYSNPVKKRYITPWDVIDIAMAGASWSDLLKDPSLRNLGYAVLDTAALAPLIPSTGYLRHGNKLKAVQELYKKNPKAVRSAIKVVSKYTVSSSAWKDIAKFKQKGLKEAFEKAIKKGVVGPQGKEGIKYMPSGKNYKGVKYNYEVKVLGSRFGDFRLYGNKNSKGVIEFTKGGKH